jgi:hypothetical protein
MERTAPRSRERADVCETILMSKHQTEAQGTIEPGCHSRLFLVGGRATLWHAAIRTNHKQRN